ncbi:flagellar basal-body MS-ring/collar protein FliF [Endozoicomonas arenosclerae]|uniref:flagellar basal-body MS-ring/collar protein FliF n=1 Tax=Endozoicomonas arenosclerae TaxID=1633495 RepID=UPI00078665CD|nr:flagellar basal-body MS-ring/collar protein FliF [Endozoicomonas arenosclerae]
MAEKKKQQEETVIEHEEVPQWRRMLEQIPGFFKGNARNQGMLLIALSGTIALTMVLFIWSQTSNWQPLYGNQEMYDASSITQVLESRQINYRIHPDTGQVMVDASEVSAARMQLSAAGIKTGLPEGLKVLEKEQGLGTSQFIENARYRHGLEGELAKTIISLKPVRNARVHLALPKRTAFVRKQAKSSASVFIDLFAGGQLDNKQVEAIVNLVASSVPGLAKKDVSVVDQQGNLLSRDIAMSNGSMAIANAQLKYIKGVEQHYIDRVNSLLDPIIGSRNFRVQVSADVDFSRVEQTAEQYDPDQKTVRSEKGRERTPATPEALGVPGSLSNQPPDTAAENAETAATPTQNEYTRNYELNKTVRHTSFQQGRVQRISVAVVLNNSPSAVAIAGEWNQEKLDNLKELIMDSVGLPAEVADQVSLHTASFIEVPEAEFISPAWWQQPEIMTYARYGAGTLLGLAAIIFLLRPLVQQTLPKHAALKQEAAMLEQQNQQKAALDHPAVMDENTALLPPELADFDTQLGYLRKLSTKEPERVAQVIKLWMKSGGN